MTLHAGPIELLELDIDTRLAQLWGELAGREEWSLDVVAAFMRAAYGKSYCDALTETSPGSLCADHGYRVPRRMIDLVYVSWNRLEYTKHSFRALLANTAWEHVAKLILADDGSTDGTREWLDEARREVPVRNHFLAGPGSRFNGPVEAMNVYLTEGRSPGIEIVAKIDNDFVACPGWLDEMLVLLERHPDVDLLGMCPNVGPPEPCPYAKRGVRYAPFVDGNGLWRLRAFDGRPKPQRTRRDPRYGFDVWQRAHSDVVKAWAAPDLPVFCLDGLPFEPWLALAGAYVTAGWQRGWPNAPYSADADAYWSWFTDTLAVA